MIENPFEQVFRSDLFRLGLVGDAEAMAEHIVADVLDILRSDVAAPGKESLTASAARQENGRARTGPVLDVGSNVQTVIGRPPCGMHNLHNVALDLVVHIN